jgi:SAM-dependent methyltransferase
MTTSSLTSGPTAEAYAEKLFQASIATFETLSVYVGDRLGWYRSLVDDGPATAGELAVRTGTQERYCLEWLEMQASYGTLTVEHGPTRRANRFTLPPGPAEVLTDPHSLAFLGALPQIVASIGPQLPNLLQAYRQGGGVSWAQFGDDAREAQAALNRPWFESRLAPALNGCPGVPDILGAPGARIADVGCGGGWSTIALAQAYPDAVLIGFDVDPPSIEMARAAADQAGVADRVSFRLAEGETLAEQDQFDAAFMFECLHDMPRPVEILAAIRSAVRPGGLVVIMDEAVADEFAAPGDVVDQYMYGFSLFVCLPDGLSSSPSAGTGTVFRQPILADYAQRAGFQGVDVLPIEDFSFFRFYQLRG